MSEAPTAISDFNTNLNGDQAISAQDTILQALVDGSANQEASQAKLALGFTKVSKALLKNEMKQVETYTYEIQKDANAMSSADDKNRTVLESEMQASQAELQAITTSANGIDTTNKSMSDQANSNAQNLGSSIQDYANVATKATSMVASLVSSLVPSLG